MPKGRNSEDANARTTMLPCDPRAAHGLNSHHAKMHQVRAARGVGDNPELHCEGQWTCYDVEYLAGGMCKDKTGSRQQHRR